MKNGSEFSAFIDQTVAKLQDVKVIAYYPQPIPSALDEEMIEIMRRFLAETAVHQTQFQAALPNSIRSLFGIFGHRAATLAARNQDDDILKIGLVATAVANYEIPEKRRVEVGLAIFHHVARKLEQNPVDLFEEVAQFANNNMAEIMLKFGKTGPINIRNYGWNELKTDDGIKYKWG